MSDVFDDRKKGYEAKFKLDEELSFKVRARRNKLLGLWLAQNFGLNAEKTNAYSKEVIIADMDEPGVEDLIRKIMADIKARGTNLSEQKVRDKVTALEAVAMKQIKEEE